LGPVSGGGFTAYSAGVTIDTPCLGGLINSPNACFDKLPAVMGYNITADNWLIYQTPNVVGTLGMGIMSPFWNQTNQTFTNGENAVSYKFTIG
jgi:hypothetical protein